jgi:hypothetical protein
MNVWIDSCSNRKIEHFKNLKEEELLYEPTTVTMRRKRTDLMKKK